MSTGMNFTCISAFDASKDIIWSFSYKFESENGILGNCGFTTFLNFLSSQTKGGINSGLGYGPYDDGVDTYEGAEENFLAISFENAGTFALAKNGFSTGISEPIFNSITVRKNNNFEHVSTKHVNFNIVSDKWQTLRFQLTNLGHTLNVFYCDENFNYNKIATFETSDIFYIAQQLYIGMSFATPIDSSNNFKLRIKNFHFYGQAPNILPPVIEEQTEEEYLFFGNTVLLSTKIVGARPLSFEWYRDNTIIDDETNTFYYASDIGTYKLKAYNSAGYSTSKNIYVREAVEPSIVIDLDPVYTIPPGSNYVPLSISAVGVPSPSYRWYKNNILINRSNTNSITAIGEGNYVAVAYNKFNEVSSTIAEVKLTLPTIVYVEPISGMAPIAFTVSAVGGIPITYQWYKDNLIIPGATEDSYVAVDIGLYKVKAMNSAGYVMSDILSAYAELKFVIDTIPVDISTPMTVSAVGSEPISYKWYKDNVEIVAATSNTYTPDIPGIYKAVAYNLIGEITSAEIPIYTSLPARMINLGGPDCIDTELPIDPEDNKYTLEFDKPVSLDLSAFKNALTASGLTAIKINNIDPPDSGGRFKKYEILTKQYSEKYSIINTAISYSGDFAPESTFDKIADERDTCIDISLPFKIYDPYYEDFFDKISLTNIGAITIPGVATSPARIPKIRRNRAGIATLTINLRTNLFVNANEKSKFVYVGKKIITTTSGKECILRIKSKYADISTDINTFEIIFYEKNPKQIAIRTHPNEWKTYESNLKGISQYLSPENSYVNNTLLNFSLEKGSFILIDHAITLKLPPGISKDANNESNIDTMSIITKPCYTALKPIAEIKTDTLPQKFITAINVNNENNIICIGQGTLPTGGERDDIIWDSSSDFKGKVAIYQKIGEGWKSTDVGFGDKKYAGLSISQKSYDEPSTLNTFVMSDNGNIIIAHQHNNLDIDASDATVRTPSQRAFTVHTFEKTSTGSYKQLPVISIGTHIYEDFYTKTTPPYDQITFNRNKFHLLHYIDINNDGTYMIINKQIGTKQTSEENDLDVNSFLYKKELTKWSNPIDLTSKNNFIYNPHLMGDKIISFFNKKILIFKINVWDTYTSLDLSFYPSNFCFNSLHNIICVLGKTATNAYAIDTFKLDDSNNLVKHGNSFYFYSSNDFDINDKNRISISDDGNVISISDSSVKVYRKQSDNFILTHKIGAGSVEYKPDEKFAYGKLDKTGNNITVWSTKYIPKQFKLL